MKFFMKTQNQNNNPCKTTIQQRKCKTCKVDIESSSWDTHIKSKTNFVSFGTPQVDPQVESF